MNKTTQIKSEESQINVNKNQRKSKFNKFFSTVTAVMIASSIALGPMTLRGEETGDGIKKYTEMKKEELKEKIKENDKKIEEAKKKIEEANKKIEENNKAIEEAKKQEMEARNKLKKDCIDLEKWLVQVKNHCSKNECTTDQKKIIVEKDKEYSRNCEELLVTVDKGN